MSRLIGVGRWVVNLMESIRLRADKHLDPFFARWTEGEKMSEQDFMGDADRAILEQEPIRARILLRALFAAFVVFIVWAGLVNIDEVTRGDGKVIPSQQLQVLQSLDGGIVSQILVKEGDVVNAGQVLLQVDSTRFESSVRENRSEYLSLSAKAARLMAIREGKPFDPPAGAAVVRDCQFRNADANFDCSSTTGRAPAGIGGGAIQAKPGSASL